MGGMEEIVRAALERMWKGRAGKLEQEDSCPDAGTESSKADLGRLNANGKIWADSRLSAFGPKTG